MNLKKHAIALLSTVLGSTLVFCTIVLINRYSDGPQADDQVKTAKLDYEKKEKPKPKKQVEKKKPPRKPQQRRAPAPIAGLSSLSGLDLGLSGFGADDLGDLTEDLLGGSKNVVMTDDSVDDAPRPTVQGAMAYPPRAKAQGIEGYVLLSVLISPTGDVERVKVLEANPSGIFEEVAVSGVKSWKFEPASYNGESVRVWARQRVRFDLS